MAEEKSKPHPDLTVKAQMEEQTEVFKRVVTETRQAVQKLL